MIASASGEIVWPYLVAQLLTMLVIVLPVIVLFVFGARATLRQGKGLEVPVWLVLQFFIPIIFPILALAYFGGCRREQLGQNGLDS